jgi:hypothetical protein
MENPPIAPTQTALPLIRGRSPAAGAGETGERGPVRRAFRLSGVAAVAVAVLLTANSGRARPGEVQPADAPSRAGRLAAAEDAPAEDATAAGPQSRPRSSKTGSRSRTGPESDPDDLTVWPNQTSHANSDTWLVEHHDAIRQMRPRVLVINFVNGLSARDGDARARALIGALAESTRYHGYARSRRGRGFLQYQFAKYVDLSDSRALPPTRQLDGNSSRYPRLRDRPDGINFRYDALYSAEFAALYKVPDAGKPGRYLTLAEMVEGGLVHEVWFLAKQGDHGAPFECTEVKQAYDGAFKKIPGRWVQAGNGGTDKQPFIGRSLRILFINSERGPGCAMESLGHALEGTSNSGAIPYFTRYFAEFAGFDLDKRFGLPFNSLYAVNYGESSIQYAAPSVMIVNHGGKPFRVTDYFAVGGNAHFTANSRRHYDLDNTEPVMSTIEHFRQGDGRGGKDKAEPWTNAKFAAYRDSCPDCMGPWLVYWRQNMPGLDNQAKDDTGKPMKNWWPFLFY